MDTELLMLPNDILQKVKEDFEGDEVLKAISLLSCKYGDRKDPRWRDNVLRSAIYLAQGNLDRLIIELKCDDVRSILLQAEEESGGYGHYFHPMFPEIKLIKERINQKDEELWEEINHLPPEFYEHFKKE